LLHARVQKVGTTGTSDSLILVRVWLDLTLLAGMSGPPTRCDRLARSRAAVALRRLRLPARVIGVPYGRSM